MTRNLFAGAVAALVLCSPLSTWAQYTVDVYPSLGPNGNGSPSIFTYGTNAISALETGATSAGTPGTPGYYSQLPKGATIMPSSLVATNINSWNGVANPGTPYNNEVGNLLFFGFHVHSATPQNITSLSVNLTPGATGPGSPLAAGLTKSNFANFSPFLVGYNSGNGMYYTSGALGTHTITDLYYAGLGTGFQYVGTAAGFPAFIQSLLQQYPNGVVTGLTGGTFTIGSINSPGGTTVGANYQVNIATPEPASLAVLGVGVVGLLGYAYRRRRGARPLSAGC